MGVGPWTPAPELMAHRLLLTAKLDHLTSFWVFMVKFVLEVGRNHFWQKDGNIFLRPLSQPYLPFVEHWLWLQELLWACQHFWWCQRYEFSWNQDPQHTWVHWWWYWFRLCWWPEWLAFFLTLGWRCCVAAHGAKQNKASEPKVTGYGKLK